MWLLRFLYFKWRCSVVPVAKSAVARPLVLGAARGSQVVTGRWGEPAGPMGPVEMPMADSQSCEIRHRWH